MSALECPFCGFRWWPRKENPRACPNCKRYFWKQQPKAVDLPKDEKLLEQRGIKHLGPDSYVFCVVCGERATYNVRGVNVCEKHVGEALKLSTSTELLEKTARNAVNLAQNLQEAIAMAISDLKGAVPDNVVIEKVTELWQLERL